MVEVLGLVEALSNSQDDTNHIDSMVYNERNMVLLGVCSHRIASGPYDVCKSIFGILVDNRIRETNYLSNSNSDL